MSRILIGCLLLLFVGSAVAEQVRNPYLPTQGGVTEGYTACLLAAGKGDHNVCLASEFDHHQATLDIEYSVLFSKLDPAAQQALDAEQKRWVADRAKSCGVADTPEGVAKNACAVSLTLQRAHVIDGRLNAFGPGDTSVVGKWGYRSRCDMGHFVEFAATQQGTDVKGTWSDGTDTGGDDGQFSGAWRSGRLYVRFSANAAERGGYPVCPAYGNEDAYFVPEAGKLVWYRSSGPASDHVFEKYVSLNRKPQNGEIPFDMHCSSSN